MSALVLNTRTGRHVKVGSPAYKKTLASGYQHVGPRLLSAQWAALQRRLTAAGSPLMLDPAHDFDRVSTLVSEYEAAQAQIQASRARAAMPTVLRAPATGADAPVRPVTDADLYALLGINPEPPLPVYAPHEPYCLRSNRGQLAFPTARGPVSVGYGPEVGAALSAYASANIVATPVPARGPALERGDTVVYFSHDSLRLDKATAEVVVKTPGPS